MMAQKVVAGILLLVPFIAVLVPQFYNKIDPTLGGLPYFIWYQLIWVVVGGILVFASYQVYNAGRTQNAKKGEST
jgi:hypothetical protein